MKSLNLLYIIVLIALAIPAVGDLTPSGSILSVTAPESIKLGEKLRNIKISFAEVQKEHKVTVRWADTKGRICSSTDLTIAPPAKTLSLDLNIDNPLGYSHRIEILVDGKLQPQSCNFHVIYPYKPWVDYEAIVWASYDAGWSDMLRNLGMTGTIWRGQKTIDSDFNFYPDNIVYEVFAYYHKRRGEHKAMKELWAANPERRVINHRRPSLTDEGTWVKVRDRLIPKVEECRDYRPLYYNVADEIGVADQSAVSDLDWEYSSRTAWRNWLEKKYGNLANLNKQWETDFASWSKVRAFFPTTNYMYDQLWRDCLLPNAFGNIEKFNAAFGTAYTDFAGVVEGYKKIRSDDKGMVLEGLKERFKTAAGLNGKLGTEFPDLEKGAAYIAKYEEWISKQNAVDTRGWNLSWWADFRDYMDDYMADGLKRGCDIGRESDPGGRFGITGTHHPGAYNGHNYARLINAVDFIIPYNIGQSFELVRGFDPDFLFMHPTWRNENQLKRDLWYHFLHGVHGVVFWDNHEAKNKLIDRKSGKPTVRGESAQPVLKEITAGTDRLLLQSNRDHNGIAIYHSQPSIRVEWFHRNIGIGRKYIMRHSWHEYKECGRSMLRTAWIKLIEDNHLQFVFVSPEQVAEGRLDKEKIKLLILPEVWAMSTAEAGHIAAFVKNGGTVIADQNLGLYDSHGKRRKNGVLDDFFGINQSGIEGDPRTALDPKKLNLPNLESEVTRLEFKGPAGKVGRTIFLNTDLAHYGRIRTKDAQQSSAIAAWVGSFFPETVKPFARVLNAATGKSQPGTEVGVWYAGQGQAFVAVWRNYQLNKDGIGGEDYTDNSLFEKEENIKITFDRKWFIVNQRTGESYGETDSVALKLDPWEPVILTVQKKALDELPVILEATETIQAGGLISFAIAGQDLPQTLQVFHVEAYDPEGKKVWYFEKDLSTFQSQIIYTAPVALNEKKGKWKFKVIDAATKQSIEFPVTVK